MIYDMIDPSNNNYNNGMKDQFLGKMYQIVSMFGVRKKNIHQLEPKKQMRNGILF